ncbi:MAG: ribosome recycling factor [Candidatus Dasytiphilus stammeri]
MINTIKNNTVIRMEECVNIFYNHINKIHTGRVTPSLINSITVEYYGIVTPLRQLVNIITEDSRTLTMTVFDSKLIPAIEKAIFLSDLGVTPNSIGTKIRLIFPVLSEERRMQLSKLVKKEAEYGKICIRNVRRDLNIELKEQLKKKAISEDEEHRRGEELQKVTNDYIKKIDIIQNKKIKDIFDF